MRQPSVYSPRHTSLSNRFNRTGPVQFLTILRAIVLHMRKHQQSLRTRNNGARTEAPVKRTSSQRTSTTILSPNQNTRRVTSPPSTPGHMRVLSCPCPQIIDLNLKQGDPLSTIPQTLNQISNNALNILPIQTPNSTLRATVYFLQRQERFGHPPSRPPVRSLSIAPNAPRSQDDLSFLVETLSAEAGAPRALKSLVLPYHSGGRNKPAWACHTHQDLKTTEARARQSKASLVNLTPQVPDQDFEA